MQRRHFLAAAAASCAIPTLPTRAAGKPVRIVVPYAAGGAIDLSVRRMATMLEADLGTVIIENRPGGGGGIGMAAVARAPADGLTLGIAAVATNAINPWLFANLAYDPIKDFAPITQMTRIPNVLVVNAEAAQKRGIASLGDFLAFARRESGKLTYASGGNGSAGHLAGEMFKRDAQVDIVHVPYNGGAPSQLALLSGQVDCSFDNLASAAANIRAGKLKALAVTTAQRSELLPDLPAVAEKFKGFEIDTWWGLVAPAGTTADVVQRLNQLAVKALHSAEVMGLYRDMMMETVTNTPDAFGAFMRHELARYQQVVRVSGATVG